MKNAMVRKVGRLVVLGALALSLTVAPIGATAQDSTPAPAPVKDGFTFAASGDMIGPYKTILKYNDAGVEKIAALLRAADASFANLEGSIFDLASFKGSPAAVNGGGTPLAERLRSDERPNCGGIAPSRIGPAEPFLHVAGRRVADQINVGRGRVIVLNGLKSDQEQLNRVIAALLEKLGVERPLVCDPPVPFVVREDDNALFVIVYDVSQDLAISDTVLDLTLTIPFDPAAAIDLLRSKQLSVQGHKVRVALRKGHGTVIRLDRGPPAHQTH